MVYTKLASFVIRMKNIRKGEFTVIMQGPRGSWETTTQSENQQCIIPVQGDQKILITCAHAPKTRKFSMMSPAKDYLYMVGTTDERYTVYSVVDGPNAFLRIYPSMLFPTSRFTHLITAPSRIQDQYIIRAEPLQAKGNDTGYAIAWLGRARAHLTSNQIIDVSPDVVLSCNYGVLAALNRWNDTAANFVAPNNSPYAEVLVTMLKSSDVVLRDYYDAAIDRVCLEHNLSLFWGRISVETEEFIQNLNAENPGRLTAVDPRVIWMDCFNPGRYLVSDDYLIDFAGEIKVAKIPKVIRKIERFERVIQNGGRMMRAGHVVSDPGKELTEVVNNA